MKLDIGVTLRGRHDKDELSEADLPSCDRAHRRPTVDPWSATTQALGRWGWHGSVFKGDKDYAYPLFSFSMSVGHVWSKNYFFPSNVGLLPHVSYILLESAGVRFTKFATMHIRDNEIFYLAQRMHVDFPFWQKISFGHFHVHP
jgi:hypothetical protein